MALSVYIEATYADGFVLREDEADVSPYDSGKNIFHAILTRRPETAHGPLRTFALITPDLTYSVDWTQLPDNARPIRFKHMTRDFAGHEWSSPARTERIDFGYQFTDGAGSNVQEIHTVEL